MKLFKYLIVSAVFLTILYSCGGNAKPIPVTFVFDAPLEEGHYPEYFKQIAMPFTAPECNEDYLLKPISVTRLDIKKAPVETNAWYFEKMGDNTVEFSKTWLNHYFKDSLMLSHMYAPAKRAVNDKTLDSYLKKTNVLTLIYSEESDEETYNDHPIFSSAKEVSKKIQESICGDKYKEVVILVNPKKLKTPLPPPPPPPPPGPCNVETITGALSLKEDISEIISTGKSLEDRLDLAEKVWEKYFTKNAYVALYQNREDNNPDVWNPGEGEKYFTNRLAMLESIVGVAIFRVEYSKVNNKISGIHIVECQNASEAL